MSFVVIGGGPTGVELVGSLAELARATLKAEYRHIDPAKARIILVDAAPRILGEFPETLSAYAAKALEGLGVELKMKRAVRGDRRPWRHPEGRTDRCRQRLLVRRHAGRARRRVDRRRRRPQQGCRGHERLFGPEPSRDLRDRRRRELQDGRREDPAGSRASRQAARRLCREGDRQPHRRAETSWPLQIHQSRNNGGHRPLARHRRARRRQADGPPRVALVVACPSATADRLPQPHHGVHQLGLGVLHLWTRRAAGRRQDPPGRRGRSSREPRAGRFTISALRSPK